MSATEPDVVTVSDRTVWEWRLQRPSEEPAEAQEGFRAALEDAVARLAARDGVAAAEHWERDGLCKVALTLREGTPDSWAWQVRDCTELLEGIGGLSVVESASCALKRVERQPARSKLPCTDSEMSNLDGKDSKLEAALLARIDALVQQHAQNGEDRSSTLAQIMDELKSGRHKRPELTGTEALVALAESQSIGQAETQLHGSALRLIGGRLSSAESRCKLAIETTLDESPIHVLFPARSDRDRLLRCNELLTHAVEEIESCRHLCTQFTDFMVACAVANGKEGAAFEERAAEAEARCEEALREAEAEEAGEGDAETTRPEGEEGAEEAQGEEGEEGDQEGQAAEAMERAAVRLQSARRGSLARQEAQLLRVQQQQAAEAREQAVVRLQSARRGSLARKDAQLLRLQQQEAAEAREKAAVRLQAARRGSLARQEAQLLREQQKAAAEAAAAEAAAAEAAAAEAAAAEAAAAEGAPAADVAEAKEGQWYIVSQETLDIWQSTQSWEAIGSLSQGDYVQAAGPTEEAEGIVMLPILLEGGTGAVEFGCLELYEEAEGEGQGEQAEGAEKAEADAEGAQEEGDEKAAAEIPADAAQQAIVPAEDAPKHDGPMDPRQLEALMSSASKSRLAKKGNVEEGIPVTTCEFVLKPFDDGNKKWKCSNESPDCSRMVGGPKERWSCPRGEYNLCKGCVEFYRKKAIVAKFDKSKKPWDACTVREAEGCGLPLAVVVKDAKEEWLNGTLLLSSTKDSLEERGAYVYGAFAERTDGNWPYMWFDAKALKWKFSSWQKGQVKAPSLALCRAEIQSVQVGAVLGDWTLSKGPKTILPMTVNAMTEDEFWESEAREMVPLDLTDVLSVVTNTAANLLEEDLHLDTPFMESGFTSAMAVQYRMILNGELAVNLPATLMFDHPNMRSIGHYIVDLSRS